MTESAEANTGKRKILVRGFFMLFIFHVMGTVIFIVTLIQFIMTLLTDANIPRLVTFGRRPRLGGLLAADYFLLLKKYHSLLVTGLQKMNETGITFMGA